MFDDYDNKQLHDFCKLIDTMVYDIMYLEAEVVHYRYLLSCHLDASQRDGLRQDLVSNLAGRYGYNDAYVEYMDLYYQGQDPLESVEHTRHILRLAHIEYSDD